MANRLGVARETGKLGDISRWTRRIRAIEGLRDCGPDPSKMISSVILPEGYDGKILMVSISGGVVENMICLRSGDDWHQAILTNTREEIVDLGFESSVVHELGGASVCFETNGTIIIWGTSDEFGACDKRAVATMISNKYPLSQVVVRN